MDQLQFKAWKVGMNIAELCEHCDRIIQLIRKGNSYKFLVKWATPLCEWCLAYCLVIWSHPSVAGGLKTVQDSVEFE